jgi:hypothetical protein
MKSAVDTYISLALAKLTEASPPLRHAIRLPDSTLASVLDEWRAELRERALAALSN